MPALIDIARQAHAAAVGRLDYASDRDAVGVADDWRSHAQALLADPTARYRDDCDGSAITAAELALNAGLPADQVRIVLVDTQARGRPDMIDHMICALGPAGVDPWVIDNCHPEGPVRASQLPYTWGAGMRASEPGTWRRTVLG